MAGRPTASRRSGRNSSRRKSRDLIAEASANRRSTSAASSNARVTSRSRAGSNRSRPSGPIASPHSMNTNGPETTVVDKRRDSTP